MLQLVEMTNLLDVVIVYVLLVFEIIFWKIESTDNMTIECLLTLKLLVMNLIVPGS
jgi:hypothetical protein